MINSRKILFFLLVYYLCLDPMLDMGSSYFTNGNIIFQGPLSSLSVLSLDLIVFVMTIFLILSGFISVSKYLNFYSGCAFFLFIWICFLVLISFFDVGLISFWEYYSFSSMIIYRGFVFILLGLNIYVINDMFQKKKTCIIFYAVTAIFFTTILLSAIYNSLAESQPWYLCGITINTIISSDYLLDYLYISDSCALILLFIMSRMKSIYVKLFIIIFGSFLLFLTHSRAVFVCFVTASMIAFIIHFFKAGIKRIVYLISLMILLTYLIIIYSPLLLNKVEEKEHNRFNFFTICDSSSYLSRKEIFDERLIDLKKTWLWGRYMSELAEQRPGMYFHNYLSFLSAFGIGPFLLLIFLLISTFCKIMRFFFKDSKSPINELLFLWGIYMIMIIVLARAYDYYRIWFIILGSSMISQRFIKKYVHTIAENSN